MIIERCFFCQFFIKTYVVNTLKVMSTDNIGFYEEIAKLSLITSNIHLICNDISRSLEMMITTKSTFSHYDCHD